MGNRNGDPQIMSFRYRILALTPPPQHPGAPTTNHLWQFYHIRFQSSSLPHRGLSPAFGPSFPPLLAFASVAVLDDFLESDRTEKQRCSYQLSDQGVGKEELGTQRSLTVWLGVTTK